MPKGERGTFTKAFRTFGKKPGITDPAALAAWWHKVITGETPTQKYSRMGWKRKGRKKGK